MTHPRIARFLVLLFAICVLPVWARGEDTVVLRSQALTVMIDPASLRVTAEPRGGALLVIATGQTGLGAVTSLDASDEGAAWELTARDVSVEMRLRDTQLTVEIRSRRAGAFTWPTMELRPLLTALIWPYWEGRYIPLGDARWQSFLTGRTWNTLDGLCMPFWGLQTEHHTVTYITTNRFNNAISFEISDGHLATAFRHTFPKIKDETEWAYGFVIQLDESTSPVAPARAYRAWLVERDAFVPMSAKRKEVPAVERLLGAPHAYLWGDALLSRHDIKPRAWQGFCKQLVAQARADEPSVGRRIHTLLPTQSWQHVEEVTETKWPSKYRELQICGVLSQLLERRDFYDAAAWREVTLPDEARTLLARDRAALSLPELCRMNSLLLRAAYPRAMLPVTDWGDGVSLQMLRALKEAGLKRMRLCLAGWEGIEKRPRVARTAREMGYLFGTYDSFHSIHDPKLAGSDASWPTAQFDQHLYESGAIVKEDGRKRAGFKQRGYLLSPLAARPYVEKRVRANMRNVPYNHYFVDCDAYGQVFDDYAPQHRATQEQDAAARAARLAWIRDTFDVVIGSEGGCSYFAPVIHVAEGMFTPVIGWGDADMRDRESPYYVGGYYPPDGPRRFVQSVPLKEEYVYLHYDPRFRLPLNEIVFHDSFVSTHHWGSGSLKFTNVRDMVALTEMLYQCPPLYHLNLDEFRRHRNWIVKHDRFFGPIHRAVGFAAMTDFTWLTANRLVQRTTFDDRVELIANFADEDFERGGLRVPARSVVARWLGSEKSRTYRPAD